MGEGNGEVMGDHGYDNGNNQSINLKINNRGRAMDGNNQRWRVMEGKRMGEGP